MEATVTLTAPEACEAVRAYLVLRGALPAHGTVKKVKQGSDGRNYGAANIEADIEIGEAPVSAPGIATTARRPMRSPLPPKRKAAREDRPLWAIVRDGCPVSRSASSIGPSECWLNWHARSCVTVLEMPGDRIVKYLPAPTRARKGGKS